MLKFLHIKRPQHVQVLVVYLGDGNWQWFVPEVLLPFEKHEWEKTSEGEAAIQRKALTQPVKFRKAVKVQSLVVCNLAHCASIAPQADIGCCV